MELKIKTKEVARAIARPVMTVPVTARVGHIPRSCRKTGFSSHIPLRYSARMLLVAILCPCELPFLLQFLHSFQRTIDDFQHLS